MTTVLPLLEPGPGAPPLAADLLDAGLHALPATSCDKLVRDALQQSPDLLVCWDAAPADALLGSIERLGNAAPLPVLVFTQDASVESMQRALRAGVHGWVVNGYAKQRLRALCALARERFARERELHESLLDMRERFEERKRVDRAKGLLMRAARLGEDEAFRALRAASMRSQRRVGAVAQHVIDAARDGEAVNRAGQLRMLSQRVVKLAALAGDGGDEVAALLSASLQRADANLDALGRLLSRPTFGDFVDALRDDWATLRTLLERAPVSLAALDTQAEACLVRAERLVAALDTAGGAPTLPLVNLSGRQRMLSQRVAKRALLGELVDDGSAAAFEHALARLRSVAPADAGATLDGADEAWRALLAAAARAAEPAARRELLARSEALLDAFERLTAGCEQRLDAVIDPR